VHGKLIYDDHVIAAHALTADQEVGLDIIQPRDLQEDAAQADQIARRGRAVRPETSAPCTAIACAAYSTPHAQPRRPCDRSGFSASRCVAVRHSMRVASQLNTASNRHILPACGI